MYALRFIVSYHICMASSCNYFFLCCFVVDVVVVVVVVF